MIKWATIRKLIGLATVFSIGMLMAILAAVLDRDWHPVWPLVFFIAAGTPAAVHNRKIHNGYEGCLTLSSFLTALLFTSGIGSIVSLYYAHAISSLALSLDIPGGILLFSALYYYSRQFVAVPETPTDEQFF